jgi:TatD DNase family protein
MAYLIANGYYISLAGPITYKTAKKSLEIVREIPKELFLVETDSPYMTPEPHREEVNNSNNLKYIISKIADIKDMSFEEAEDLTAENTKKLFKKMI